MKNRLIEQLVPYLVLGTTIALLLGICIILSSILLWGLCIGTALWAFAHLKLYLTKKMQTPSISLIHPTHTRIIEYRDTSQK